MQIEVQNLRRYFGQTRAVDDISFSFNSGQIFGFIGPNGAGKTTTMRIMATLDEPTAGRVSINGTSVTDEPEQARRLVGYMPDNLPTHRDITVHEYLDFFARAYNIHNPKRDEVIESIEAFTNLTGIRDKTLKALSKGMKQRVSLARALVHDPPLLVLDEPAAGLDPRARVELRELLKVLAQRGKAILISSHILTELAEIIDGAVIIEHGRMVTAGTIQEILAGSGVSNELTKVLIKPMGEPEPLFKAMLEMPHVEDVVIMGDQIEVDLSGGEEEACDLLAELVRREFRIVEFKQHRAHLEDIFMNVTQGHVQ